MLGREGHSPGAGAGRQLVPGGEGSAEQPDEFDLYSESNGSSELGSGKIKVVFISDLSDWALGEDILEQVGKVAGDRYRGAVGECVHV